MKKLIFEDTTVIKKPFVEIDGVEYEVQDGEFEGGTDLNAQNFNQVQDNIEDYIDGEISMGSIIVEDIECKNLFDKNTIIEGVILNRDNGQTTTNGTYGVTDYIEVEINKQYTMSNFNSWYTCYYDKNKNYISASDGSNTITIPEEVKYFRTSLLLTDLDIAQIEKDSIATDYVEHKEFGYTINELIKKMINIPSDFLKSTVNVDDLYNVQGIKAYPIWDQYPASMPNGAYQYGTLIVITQSTTNMFLNTQIYITDGVHASSSDNIRGVYVRTGKNDWLRISGTRVSKKTASTTSTTNNGNLEVTDI